MSVIIEAYGKKFEFRGEYRVPQKGDYFLISGGTMLNGEVIQEESRNSSLGSRAIVHLIPDILEFGGIKFIKTGEVRMPLVGEWYLSAQTKAAVYCSGTSKWNYASKAEILKPYFESYVDSSPKKAKEQDNAPSFYCPKCWSPKTYSIQLPEKTVRNIAFQGYIPQGAHLLSDEEKDIVFACRKAIGR